MKAVHLCVPVLKRYDLLREMLLSLRDSTVAPELHVIDNGHDRERLMAALVGFRSDVCTPEQPMGIAESWNWFIQNVPEERLICNDDVMFAPGSLEKMAQIEGDFVSALPGTNAFSCFLLRDSCVEKVGLFDEDISPGYAYFEDCDYVERMILQGIPITDGRCGVDHKGSQTLAMNSPQEWDAHHDKFRLAQSNFIKKWGRMPNEAMAKAQYEATR